MSELLIPFGIHKDTGVIIEPEDALKGRACACLCPGCKAPLLSRHPKVNRIHFAHDSRHENSMPEAECPFSSAVAVAMMVREIAPALVGKRLHTPRYQRLVSFSCCSCQFAEVLISNATAVVIDVAESNVVAHCHHFDLKLMILGYPIFIALTYSGKPLAALVESELVAAKAGVLELDCDSFSSGWGKEDKTKRFSEAVIEFVLGDGPKSWCFHPRQTERLTAAKANHQCDGGGEISELNVSSPTEPKMVAQVVSQSLSQPVEITRRHYHCVMCKQDWVHLSDQSFSCPSCNSHLYSREV